MSLLQTSGVCRKTDRWHLALTPSAVTTSDMSEVTETDEDIFIPNAWDAPRLVSDGVAERRPPAWEVITEYLATSFVIAVVCATLALALLNVMFPSEWVLIDP
jgi:hypothetical protein